MRNPFSELTPYEFRHIADHLAKAGRSSLLQQLLLDGFWLQAKLVATDVTALLEDFSFVPDAPSTRKVENAIRHSAHVLRNNKEHLVAQLFGRIAFAGASSLTALSDQLLALPIDGLRIRPVSPTLIDAHGALVRTFTGHTDIVNAVVATPDGNKAVSAARDNLIMVWDLNLGTVVAELHGHEDRVACVSAMPDGIRVVSGSEDGTLRIWNIETGTLLSTISAHAAGVLAVAVTPDGRRVVSGEGAKFTETKGVLKVWDAETGRELHALNGHIQGVTGIAIPRRMPGLAISASYDGWMRLWDIDDGVQLAAFKHKNQTQINGLAVTSDGNRAYCACNTKIIVWNIPKQEVIDEIESEWPFTSIAIAPNGETIVAGTDDGYMMAWNRQSGLAKPFIEIPGHGEAVSSIALLADGIRAVSASADRTVRLWHLGNEVSDGVDEELLGHGDQVNSIIVSRDARIAVSASGSRFYPRFNTIKVWDAHTGESWLTLSGHEGAVLKIVLSDDNSIIVSVDENGNTKIWDLNAETVLDGKSSMDFVDKPGAFAEVINLYSSSVSTSFSGCLPKRQVYADKDGSLFVSDTAALTTERTLGAKAPLYTIHGFTGPSAVEANGIAVSPDGNYGISGLTDNSALVWDLQSGLAVAEIPRRASQIYCASLSTAAQYAVIGTADGVVGLWETEHRPKPVCIAEFILDYPVSACALSPDNQVVVVGDMVGRVHFLHLESATVADET